MIDPDELNYPSYDIELVRVSDNELRVYHEKRAWSAGTWYWWTDGNMGCDCNRALCFARAAGETDPDIDDVPCGDSRYRLIAFKFPDRFSIPGPEADPIDAE